MRLEDVTVTLRPRQPWEAIDLGCALVRRDFGRLLALWSVTVFPVWLGICVVMRAVPEWIPLVVWWLKPLYDRVPLFFLSRSAFGVRPGFAQTWKAWPRLWLSGFLPALLWRRLSFIRSFALPAQMLEGLRGFAVKRRVKALALDGGGSGFLISYAFLKIETVLLLGLLWGTYDFLPESMTPDMQSIFTSFDFEGTIPPGAFWWVAVCYMVVVTLVEPFYVGAGFGLYLNCRTRIEGWDVELAFRRLGSRLVATTAACVLGLACLLGTGTPALAAPRGEAEAKVKEVLKSSEFEVHKIQSKRWVPDMDIPEVSGKPWHLDIVAAIGEILFWGIVAGLTAWLVYYLIKNRHVFVVRRARKAVVAAPAVVMGMNITRASLPDDIVAAARAAWAAGDFKEALSLLYRGSLSWLVTRRRVPITDSDTEEECLSHVLMVGPQAEADYFRQLTGAWVQAAYALLPVSNAEMNALCDAWPFVEKGGRA
ncbi:MAG: DUF4129 domain-containing protein [Prosthecobacter sp.]